MQQFLYHKYLITKYYFTPIIQLIYDHFVFCFRLLILNSNDEKLNFYVTYFSYI